MQKVEEESGDDPVILQLKEGITTLEWDNAPS